VELNRENIERRFNTGKWQVRDDDGCHVWVGSKFYHGYGKFRIGDKIYTAHRVAWYLHKDHWPERHEVVFQTCGHHDCVNIAHLVLVPKDSRDFKAIARRLARPPIKRGFGGRKDPTKCKAGKHLWIPENIRIINRSPSCIQCNREQSAAWRARRKDDGNGSAAP
jgi:hypothetical protein